MPEQFRDGGQGELLASYMSGTFSEDAARKLCFEQDNQIRVLKQEVEYRKKRDEKLTYVAADLTGRLADAEINLAAAEARCAKLEEALRRNLPVIEMYGNLSDLEAADAALARPADKEKAE